MDFYLYLGIFLAVDLVLVAYILYRHGRKKFSQKDLGFFRAEWKKIITMEDGKHAVLDADKLFHVVMKKKGFQGNVGDQLKKGSKMFSNLNDLWAAHKLRNRVAHELDVRVSYGEKQQALHSFERALKDLGAL